MASRRAEHPQERIDAAKAGDEQAWRALYDDLAPAVLGYLRVRGARDPEDVTGEVFLHAAQRIHQFEGSPAGFRSWIFTIAHHRLVDDHRAAARRPLTLVEQVPEQEATHTTDADALDAVGTDRVRALLDQLSADQRDVLLLRLIAGLTIDEIAQLLGKTVGSTKQLQRRGLRNVARRVGLEQRHEHESDLDVPP
jgi:RNA polymerase sigma-70 factor (ECF subfamily)